MAPLRLPGRTNLLIPSDESIEKYYKSVPRPLVVGTRGNTMFITVSPPPSLKIRVLENGKLSVRRYDMLHQANQLTFCHRLIEALYIPYITDGYLMGTWELNKSGHVHVHFLLYDRYIQNDYQLAMFRRSIKIDPISRKIMGRQKNDYMNNIFYCDDVEDRLDYMDKDTEQKKDIDTLYSNFFYKNIEEDP